MEAMESNINIVEEEDINLGTNTKQKGISLKDLGNNKKIDPGYHQVVQFSSATWKFVAEIRKVVKILKQFMFKTYFLSKNKVFVKNKIIII